MTLTSEEIATKEFLVGLRGYDKDEVRAFLVTVAREFVTAGAPQAADAPTGDPAPEAAGNWANLGDEIAAVLRTAHDQAAALKGEAEADATRIRSEAEADAARIR